MQRERRSWVSGVRENKPPLNCMLAGSSIPIVLQHFPWARKGSEESGAMARTMLRQRAPPPRHLSSSTLRRRIDKNGDIVPRKVSHTGKRVRLRADRPPGSSKSLLLHLSPPHSQAPHLRHTHKLPSPAVSTPPMKISLCVLFL